MRRGREINQCVENFLNAEIVYGGAEKHGRKLRRQKRFTVKRGRSTGDEFNVRQRVLEVHAEARLERGGFRKRTS